MRDNAMQVFIGDITEQRDRPALLIDVSVIA
jgi:hypothetical protein